MPVDHLTKSFVALQSEVLEKIAYGEPLASVVDHLCKLSGKIAPEALCSVLRVDRNGALRTLGAPHLPETYVRAIDGFPVAPTGSACGTAAFHGIEVEINDVEHHEQFAMYRSIGLPSHLRACWSSPIKARDGRVVGTFAFYYSTPRGPSDIEREVVARCTHLCSIAIEHNEIHGRLHELAFIDTLSGVPNRASFNQRIQELTTDVSRPFALLLMDVDHLKEVNDTLGHAAGDLLVSTTALRIRSAPLSLEVFRVGGDEFAIILTDCATEAAMEDAARVLIDLLRQPILYDRNTIVTFVTVGGVVYHGDKVGASTLYQNADFALYAAKAEFRGSFIPYVPGMRTAMTRRIQSIRDVSDALADDRIYPAYQPIVSLETNEFIGVEALARMRTPDGKVVSAGDFHGAIMDPRIGNSLTSRMLVEVAKDIRSWLDQGMALRHVGINVTSSDFQTGDLEDRIIKSFGKFGIPFEHVMLEINETVFMDGRGNRLAKAANMLRGKGMRVALDDFGTGHASLTHLLNFPVDVIKIDKSFVDRIIEDRRNLVIVQSLIEVARKLDIQVIAEGIETQEQADKLLALGCQLGQGFRFGRPLPAAEALALLLGRS